MELIADGVLILAALAAMAYCMVLSRRLRRLTELDGGLGAAITALSREVDHLNGALAEAKTATTDSATDLGAQCRAAHIAARRLETLVKSANSTAFARAGVNAKPDDEVSEPDRLEKSAPVGDDKAKAPDTKSEQDQTGEAETMVAAETTAQAKETSVAKRAKPKTTRKPKVAAAPKPAPPQAPDVEPDPAPELAFDDLPSIDTLDASTLDQFIGAIISKGDADDNAVLARRLVMALAAQQQSGSK